MTDKTKPTPAWQVFVISLLVTSPIWGGFILEKVVFK